MRHVILILAFLGMWIGADFIFDNHLLINTAPWWREIFIMAAGVTIGELKNYR